jgi:hypothetical protein
MLVALWFYGFVGLVAPWFTIVWAGGARFDWNA